MTGTSGSLLAAPGAAYARRAGKFAANGAVLGGPHAVTRLSVGVYRVVFATPMPTNDYVISSETEDTIGRDSIETHVIPGSVSAAGFEMQVHEGDNGAGPNVYRDRIVRWEASEFA